MLSGPPQTSEVLGYAAPPQDAKRGMAAAALVCGLLGLLSFCPIFGVPALLGIIFGIIAMVRASNQPGRRTGRGMAIAGAACGFVGILIALVAPVPILSRPHTLSKRTVCSANLRGVGVGMTVYANDNLDWLPVSPFAQIENPDPINATRVGFIGEMSANLTSPSVGNGTAVHPSRSFFLLITDGSCTTKQFTCPSTDDTGDDLLNYSGGTPRASQPGVDRFDFLGYSNLSYGYHLPYGAQGRVNIEYLDPRMALAADKGPYFQAGTLIAAEQRVPDAPIGQPGANIMIPGVTSNARAVALKNDTWRPFNSPNHQNEGQNVLFLDGHVNFSKKPTVGVNGDNIYTMQSGYTTLDALFGQQPADFFGPLTNTDSVIVP